MTSRWRSALEELRARPDVFTEVLTIDTRFTNLDGRAARGSIVSGNYFSMLDGGTAIGRPLQSTDTDAVLVAGLVGRLRPGVTPTQATAALTSFARAATQDRDASERAQGVELRSKAAMLPLPPQFELALLPLFVAIGLTMTIPCANVTNMVSREDSPGSARSGSASRWARAALVWSCSC